MAVLLSIMLFTPLVGALINGLLGSGFKNKAHWVAIPGLGIPFAIAIYLVYHMMTGGAAAAFNLFTWMPTGGLAIPFGFYLDQLSTVMAFTVTGVSFFVHVYSMGYMKGDPGYRRFFAYLNLFVFFMLVLILANSYLLMFVGWEGVGLCSYLLIGFWYEKKSASDAGKKAFIVNRIGDAGFLLGMFLLFFNFGTLRFTQIFPLIHSAHAHTALLTAAALLLFLGAVGKSAQFPLYVWLPDAMEGPTPVSALIHAATMVTAGVYMVARSNPLYSSAPQAGYIVASVGAFTAIFAATMALVNNDIKRILAYSTVSQLGYMFIAVGLGSYAAGIFHLYTHAFFKGLLFLAAGSVMHAMHDVLDIQRMGGLMKKAPQTAAVFIIGSLALSGIPPFAGFFSKDEILHAAAASGHTWIWIVGTITAFMTAFYMFRAVFLVFFGKPRDQHLFDHAHESPLSMTLPMWFLAIGAIAAGWVAPVYHNFIGPVFAGAHAGHHIQVNSTLLLVISVSVAVSGILVAGFMYLWPGFKNRLLARVLKPVYLLLYNKYWVDEIYGWVIVKPLYGLSKFALFKGLDTYVIDRGLVDGWAHISRGVGRLFKAPQKGHVRTYALLMMVGLMVIFYLVLLK